MSLWRGLAVIACAGLFGLAASLLVRVNLAGILSTLVELPFDVSFSEPPGQSVDPGASDLGASDPGDSPENPPPALRNRATLVAQAKRRASVRAARSARGVAGDAFAQGLAKGIRKLGDRHYEIKRATLEQALGNLAGLSNLVRASLEVHAGKSLGFRLSAIPDDGPFAQLGLKNGDVLLAVNGLSVASLDEALEVYRKLRTARHLVLGLHRGGHEVTQTYTIR
jgi:hypothetical protein